MECEILNTFSPLSDHPTIFSVTFHSQFYLQPLTFHLQGHISFQLFMLS